MRNPHGRVRALAQLAAAAAVTLALATPASAQFGGLKKKLKGQAAQEGVNKAATAAGAPAAPAEAANAAAPRGGTVVLTDDVVGQLLTGLRAGKAERDAAAKEDTPRSKYLKAQAAYADAQSRCQAAQQTFPLRMAGNDKLSNKYSELVDKMVAAQGKGDYKTVGIYQDSAMAMQDPSCTVKQPAQPDNYNDAQRDIDGRAEKQEVKASGLSQSEYAMAKERAEAILRGATPPGDASPGEKSAVGAKSAELKSLLGIQDQSASRAQKPAAPAAAAPAPAAPQTSAPVSNVNDCMMKNIQSHEAELKALGDHAERAQAAGDTQTLMAIADTMQRIQMAGCQGR